MVGVDRRRTPDAPFVEETAMTEAPRSDRDRPERPGGRRGRGRLILQSTVLAAVLLVFAFILLVSQCGTDDGSIYGSGEGTAPALLLSDPSPGPDS
jgi:hypothetical protein